MLVCRTETKRAVQHHAVLHSGRFVRGTLGFFLCLRKLLRMSDAHAGFFFEIGKYILYIFAAGSIAEFALSYLTLNLKHRTT